MVKCLRARKKSMFIFWLFFEHAKKSVSSYLWIKYWEKSLQHRENNFSITLSFSSDHSGKWLSWTMLNAWQNFYAFFGKIFLYWKQIFAQFSCSYVREKKIKSFFSSSPLWLNKFVIGLHLLSEYNFFLFIATKVRMWCVL